MCEFFSFNTYKNKFYYFTPQDIKKIKKEGNKKNWNFNSHDHIAYYFKIDLDKCNKFEYNPYSKEFQTDQINDERGVNSYRAEEWVKNLFKFKTREEFLEFCRNYFYKVNYKKLEKDLGNIPTKKDVIKLMKRIEKIDWFRLQKKIIKSKLQLKVNSILKAFKLDFKVEIEIKTLKTKSDWDSARDSAWASAWASARDSAWDSARDSARASARDSARASAWDSAWASARDSARDSARASARDSARDSAWASARASAFEVIKDLMKKKGYKVNPFEKLLQLWEMGLYPCGVLKNKKFVIYYVPLKR